MKKRGRQTGKERFTLHASLCGGGDLLKAQGLVAHYLADSIFYSTNDSGTWGYHYEEARPLTNRERARLFSYPDNFIFSGSVSQVRQQIGNSVPPVFAWHIAEALASALIAV